MSGYKRVNYYELCRLCTTTSGTKMHIFREEGRRRQLATKIPLCLPLQVAEDDSLPKIVCSSCVGKLESYYEFREACVNAEAMLESYFSTIRAEDHKEGQTATVYVRESVSSPKDISDQKLEVPTTQGQVQAQTALVLPVGTDGLSNLIHAAGIQIITDAESARLQPLLSNTSTPIIEASDGSRYTYLNNAAPTPDLALEKHVSIKPEKPPEGTSEVSQQAQTVHPQTITFAGQEMMVHFNVKDTDTTNPQLQRASIAQLGEFLKMNLVDGATLVKDPSVPGGFRILNLSQTVLTTQHMQEHEQQQHQQQLQLHSQQLQQLLQNQSIQQTEHTHHHQHLQQEQQLNQQQQINQHQHLNQQQQQLNQEHNQGQQISQQHLQHQDVQHVQSAQRKRSKRDITKDQALLTQQQSDQQPQHQHHPPQHHQHMHIQTSHDIQHQEYSSGSILQITGENDEPIDDLRDDLSGHEDMDRHDSMCSSIEAVVSGAGGQDIESRSPDKFIYGCGDCSKLFKRKEHLYQHQKLHTGERPYVCQHCDKTFIRKEHLLRHSISHAGTKQFECEQCGKNFSRKDNLHKHRKTHSSEGPFVCHTCGKSFVVKHYFLMHLACHGVAVESENGEVVFSPEAFPFKCDVCGKGYPTKAFCDSHRLRHRKLNKRKSTDKEKTDHLEAVDPLSEDKDVLDQSQPLEEANVGKDNIQELHIQQHEEAQTDIQDLGQLLDRSNVVTLQSSATAPNGVNNIIPHIIQQIVPTSSSAVIQVQSSSNGTTYICSPEILETYHRLQSS